MQSVNVIILNALSGEAESVEVDAQGEITLKNFTGTFTFRSMHSDGDTYIVDKFGNLSIDEGQKKAAVTTPKTGSKNKPVDLMSPDDSATTYDESPGRLPSFPKDDDSSEDDYPLSQQFGPWESP